MASGPTSEFLRHLRGISFPRDGGDFSDGQLLDSFLNRRDEAALAALVRRHAPMVWGVCRRVLRSHHDAEDAFQAAFLVLVRKAASVLPREMVGNWLYGVAYQTARKARVMAAKRGAREKQVADMPEPVATEQDLWRDLQPLLDDELSRLPEKYRAVLVLCDLEGKTRKEAAGQLACPEGTVAGRLARARTMLAKRLAGHGLELSGGALAAVLSQGVASAGVPPLVVASTIKAATLFAAGQAATAGVISVKVAALTEGMLKTMLLTKLKIASAVLVIVMVAGIGAGGRIGGSQAAERREGTETPTPGAANPPLNQKREGSDDRTLDAAIHRRLGEIGLKEPKEADDLKFMRRLYLVWASPNLVEFLYTIQRRDVLTKNPLFSSEESPCRKAFSPSKKPKPNNWPKPSPKLPPRSSSNWHAPSSPALPDEPTRRLALEEIEKVVKTMKEKQTKNEKKQDEKKQLEGAWVLVAKEEDGKKEVYPQGTGVWLNVSAEEFRLIEESRSVLGGGDSVTVIGSSHRLDPKQRPSAIDLVYKYKDKKKAEETWLRGIYKVEGDRLIICWGEKNKERPTEFTAEAKSGRTLTVFKRVDAKP